MSVLELGTALVVAVALGVAAVLFLRQRPQRGLLLLAAFTPFNGLLVIVPGGTAFAYWKEALLALTLLTTFVAPRTALRGLGGTGPAPSLPWWPALAALAAFGTVSGLVTAGALGLFAIKITFFYTLILVVLWRAPFTAIDRDRLVSILMGVGLLTALVGLWQQIVGGAYLVELGYQYNQQVRTAGGFLRSFSTFDAPFAFGLYVMTALVVGSAVALAEPRRPRNLLFLCSTPVLVAGMGVSIVRASYLGLAVGLLWLGVHRYRRLLIALAALAAAAVIAIPLVNTKVITTLFSSNSLDQRGSGWSEILSDILTHPFGLGLGASGSAADRIAKARGQTAGVPYQPDNYYVKIALELGPVGLWLFLLLLSTAVVSTLHAARVLRGRDAALALGVSASVVAAAAASLVSTYLEIFPLDVYFWLLLGVVGCAVTQRSPVTSPKRPSDSASEHSRCAPVAAESKPMLAS